MTYYLLLACLVLWISSLIGLRFLCTLHFLDIPLAYALHLLLQWFRLFLVTFFLLDFSNTPMFICCFGFVILYCVYYVFWFIQKLVDVILCLALFCKSISDITKPATQLPFRFEH